jgi:thiol:disulfide interchange protein
MRIKTLALFALILGFPWHVFGGDDPVHPAEPGSVYVPVHNFDPNRNADADIQAAIAEAQRTGKRIILDVGGDWCPYCHQMDKFFLEQPAIRELRDRNFVTVAIYYGRDKKNSEALSRYSKVLGVPHFFVLDRNGKLLHSQHMLDLRLGGSYDPPKMKQFFSAWAPPASELMN